MGRRSIDGQGLSFDFSHSTCSNYYLQKCLGIIKCTTSECLFNLRPQTRADGRAAQERLTCPVCLEDESLKYERCRGNVSLKIYRWKDGAHVINSGAHLHSRP